MGAYIKKFCFKKMSDNDGPSFCRRLRDATKDIHDTSDKLVNLKLGISMSNDVVWANGLLVFAKVFFQLEKSLDEYPVLGDLDIEGLRRSHALEQDLDHFLDHPGGQRKIRKLSL